MAFHVEKRRAWDLLMRLDEPEDGLLRFLLLRDKTMRRRRPEPGLVAEIERGIAIGCGMLGERELSLLACDRAEAAARDAEARAKVWYTRAIAYSYLGEYETARKWAERALNLSMDRETRRKASQTIGIALVNQGRARDARPYLKDLRDPVLRAWFYLESGDPRSAMSLVLDRRPRAYLIRARAALALRNPGVALRELAAGVRLVERTRRDLDTDQARSSFLDVSRDLHELHMRVLLERKRWREAFSAIEGSRARSFLDFISSSAWVEGRRAALPAHEVRVRQRIEALPLDPPKDPAELARRRQVLGESWLSMLRTEMSRRDASLVFGQRPRTLGEIQTGLREGEALLEYALVGQKTYAFVISRGSLRVVDLHCGPAKLQEEIDGLHEAFSLARRERAWGGRSVIDWTLEALGETLLGRVPLRGVEHLIVVPQGPLHQVPFGALRTEGRHVVERSAVTIAASASVHVRLRARARAAPSPDACLVVADPTRTMLHAGAEEDAVRRRFGDRTEVIAGTTATRKRVTSRMVRRPVVHIATHAGFLSERPELSFLRLAGKERLFASDIVRVDMSRVRVVLLTACEGGRGDHGRAGEMLGLPRAFLRAGARAVVAPLWPVEDHPSIAAFVEEFYEHLGVHGPARACQAAQRRAILEGFPPAVWATFVVFGA